MHEAYEVIKLLKLTVQIESIAAYDDKLLVGTRQGHLLMYSVAPHSSEQKLDVQLLRYNKTFSKRPIQQLQAVPQCQLLFSLSDGLVNVYDTNGINFPLIHTASKTKGATLFTLHVQETKSMTGETTTVIRCCVVVKRRIQLYYWKLGELKQLQDDISTNDVAKTVSWSGDTLCVGFRGEYTLFPLDGKPIDLFPTSSSKSQEPCTTNISDGIFALCRDGQSVLVNNKGDAEKTKTLKWSEPPITLVYDEPYLLALVTDAVEIRTLDPPIPVQTLSDLTKARLLVHCSQGLTYVASVGQVWCFTSVDVAVQRQKLLEQHYFQLALQLTNISQESAEEKSKKIHQIQTLYAFDLFHNKKFHESMNEFLKLETDPYEVIRLFPDLISANKPEGKDSPVHTLNTPKLQDRDLENGLMALIQYLTEVRHKIQGEGKINEEKQVPKSSMQLLQIIDTTLLKCYLQTNDALVAPLLRLNHCHLLETEQTLKKYQKYSDLIILYQTKGQHKKALELLQSQAGHIDSSLRGYDRTIQYLQRLGSEHINLIFEFSSWVLNKYPEDGLKIFTEDVLEVEHLPRPKVLDFLLKNHKDLVIPYLEHVIHSWEDSNPFFHNALVHQYREKLMELINSKSESAAQHVQAKLLKFLEASNHYSPDLVLMHFPYDKLFEERALILGKLGKHDKSIAIYVQILGEVKRAIEYCHKVYEKQSPGYENIYVILIRLLLSPPSETPFSGVAMHPRGCDPDLETAFELLEQYASRIPPLEILSVLPDSVPIYRIRQFLETSLHNHLNNRRQTQLLKGLLCAEHLQIQELRIQHESQSVLMTEYNICQVCKKRFGNQSAFVRYPNNDIVHFSCQDKK